MNNEQLAAQNILFLMIEDSVKSHVRNRTDDRERKGTDSAWKEDANRREETASASKIAPRLIFAMIYRAVAGVA